MRSGITLRNSALQTGSTRKVEYEKGQQHVAGVQYDYHFYIMAAINN